MKRQRAYLAQSQGVKKPKIVGPLSVTTVIPRPLGLSQAQKREVSRLINQKEEVKYVDWNFASTAIDATGATTDLCAIAQGVTQSQRVGNSIRLLSVKINGSVYAGDTVNVVRFIFWSYKMNSGNATPTIVFPLSVGSSGATAQPDSQYNFAQKKIYKILHDRQFCVSTAANPLESFIARFNVPSKVAELDFNPPSLTTGTNHVFLSVVSDSAVATHPYFLGTIRLFFTDA